MREPENTPTSYHNSPSEASQNPQSAAVTSSIPEPEKSAKSPYDRVAAARKCAEARTLRRNKALATFSLSYLLVRLGLHGADGPICASCQGVGTIKLDLDKQTFRCQSCKFKGGKLQLVKKAKSLSDWEAIGFLERLNPDASDLQDGQDSPLPTPCASGTAEQPAEPTISNVSEDKPIEPPSCASVNPVNPGLDSRPSLVQALKDGVLAATSKTPKSKAVGRPLPAAKEEKCRNRDASDLQDGQDRHLPKPCASGLDSQSTATVISIVPEDKPGKHLSCPSSHPVNPGSDLPLQRHGEDWEMEIDGRNYRIRGMGKNLAYDTLRVNLRVMWGDKFFMDQVDMSQARQRTGFIHQASQELGVSEDILKRDVGKLLLALEELQDRQIKGTLKIEAPKVKMSVEEEQEALSFLRSKDLVKRIVRDFHTCGLVGEEMNSLVGYLSAVSRKLDDPLAMIIQSLSAAGKTALLDAILRFVPPEDVYRYSSVSGQSLFYVEETDLKHKILAISELEGAERAVYSIKILQSEKSLKIASTGKDPKTGKLVTHIYFVEGPVQILFCTTSCDIDEELLNRCLQVTSNITREQTLAIQKKQREKETLDGQVQSLECDRIIRLHQNAQRLLKPIMVVNPYAPQLTFVDSKIRARRDNAKCLTLIKAIAFLHQYQREVKQEKRNGKVYDYIEVTLDDIALANRLASEVMGVSLDELSPQTRKLLSLIHTMVKEKCEQEKKPQSDCIFTRRDVRTFSGWSNTQIKLHLDRLQDMEYVVIHRCGMQGRQYSYELVYNGEGEDGKPFLLGLVDVNTLRGKKDSRSHLNFTG